MIDLANQEHSNANSNDDENDLLFGIILPPLFTERGGAGGEGAASSG
jgi:hypothetical protein